jgi:hypothetical protein
MGSASPAPARFSKMSGAREVVGLITGVRSPQGLAQGEAAPGPMMEVAVVWERTGDRERTRRNREDRMR